MVYVVCVIAVIIYVLLLLGRFVSAHELQWIQPLGVKMEYELRGGDIIAATLRFRSFFGSFATAASADGSWTFKRVGFWQTKKIGGMLYMSSGVEIHALAKEVAEMPWMVLLGWYLTVMMYMDSAAAG